MTDLDQQEREALEERVLAQVAEWSDKEFEQAFGFARPAPRKAKRLPDASFDLDGKTYGGQYWSESVYRVTLSDEGETWRLLVENSSGGEVSVLDLSRGQADYILAHAQQRFDSGDIVPGLALQSIWSLVGDMSDFVELRDFDEISTWLTYWTGRETWDWDESGSTWEY